MLYGEALSYGCRRPESEAGVNQYDDQQVDGRHAQMLFQNKTISG